MHVGMLGTIFGEFSIFPPKRTVVNIATAMNLMFYVLDTRSNVHRAATLGYENYFKMELHYFFVAVLLCLASAHARIAGTFTSAPDDYANEYDESLSDFIKEILENFRNQMKDGIPEIKVPVVDPLVIKNIDENIDDGIAKLILRMRNITIEGISGFKIESLRADLDRGFANITLHLPKLKASGYCYMNGKIIGIFPLNSDGDFFIEVSEVQIQGHAKLDISSSEGKVRVHMANLKLHLMFGPLEIEFKSLLGGGKWTQMLIKLLTGLGRGIFQHFHEDAMMELEKLLIKVINKELDKGTLNEILDKIPLFWR